MALKDYRPAQLEPQRLTSEEIENPVLVFHDLFDWGHMPEIKEMLWQWLNQAAIGNYHMMEWRDKEIPFQLYEKIEKLIEAAHVMHRQHDDMMK